ncbi:hypothetical protein JAAARDRAFT_37022 [Jaapia argillacea MUCL 33604]|uniref:Alpha/beta hydrolase fold-3 domain-containing protein n=1 Tax=Jaapia argillacea MUCL 33604 TaxID=933084 RepID=A0A067PL47_9AGAM|nr:hypothetical protein JAAARDRAFT_37022 [Jaapia argillacea MUCL 33604]
MPIFFHLKSALIYSFICPPLLVYQTILHYTKGPPHPAWGLFEDLAVSSGRIYFDLIRKVPPPTEEQSTDIPEFTPAAWQIRKFAKWRVGKGTKVDKVRIPCVDDKWIKGTAKVAEDVIKAVEVPGFWVYRNDYVVPEGGRAKADEKVVMFIPGGGVHCLTSPVPYGLAQSAQNRVLAINARAAGRPSTAFPAQLRDALAAYIYLQNVGFTPNNIMLVGESAGGFLCLALMQYLGELRDEHGLDAGIVGAAALISPACNLSRFDHPAVLTDFRHPRYRLYTVPNLAHHFYSFPPPPDLPLSLSQAISTSPYFSPSLSGTFTHLASSHSPIFIQYGDTELFADDVRKLVKRMKEQGVKVEEDEIWGGLHTDCTIRRAFGKRGGSWGRLLVAVEKMGWGGGGAEKRVRVRSVLLSASRISSDAV